MNKVISILGLPGAGKSTLIKNLAAMLGATVLHLGRFAKQIGGADEARRREGLLLEGLDEGFLDAAQAALEAGPVILDGFPRSEPQAELLVARGWPVIVADIRFPKGTEVEMSIARQVARARAEGQPIDLDRFVGKLNRALTFDLPAIERMRELGVQIVELSAVDSARRNAWKFQAALGVGLQSVSYETEILRIVRDSAKLIGVRAAMPCGTVYRPIWNGRFGPPLPPIDQDVCFEGSPEQGAKLEAVLNILRPDLRWAAKSAAYLAAKRFGTTVTTIEELFSLEPMVWRRAAVCLGSDDSVEFIMTPEVETDLLAGRLRLDEGALSTDVAKCSAQISEAVSRARKAVLDYPALRIEGALLSAFEAEYGPIREVFVEADSDRMTAEVRKRESETMGRMRWNGLSPAEQEAARPVLVFYRTAKRVASAPPRIVKAALPGVLEELRLSGAKGKSIEPPVGFGSWLHYAALEGDDLSFREWLLNQARSRQPWGGKDSFVSGMLSLELFLPHLPEARKSWTKAGEQKVTHMGWPLRNHLIGSMFLLETDGLRAICESSGLEFNKVRLALRLAMSSHDSGKLINVYTPGAHEDWGAKLFLAVKPEWVEEDVAKLAAWAIRTHDLFGRLGRRANAHCK